MLNRFEKLTSRARSDPLTEVSSNGKLLSHLYIHIEKKGGVIRKTSDDLVMGNEYYDQSPVLSHVEPVLAVKSVTESVLYWQNVLGFPDKWIWDPPTLGGVSWRGAAFIQFSKEPELATASVGNGVWIRMRNVDALYALHQKNGATIVDPLQIRPWGFAHVIRMATTFILQLQPNREVPGSQRRSGS